MVIDLILDRKDNLEVGIHNYNVHDFYFDVMTYENNGISRAMDYGTEEDVKTALKAYIDNGEYNPEIKNFIDSVSWLENE